MSDPTKRWPLPNQPAALILSPLQNQGPHDEKTCAILSIKRRCECSNFPSERSLHMNLDHVTIRTRDLQATRKFFLTVFDLEEGERPLAINAFPATGFIPGAIRSST